MERSLPSRHDVPIDRPRWSSPRTQISRPSHPWRQHLQPSPLPPSPQRLSPQRLSQTNHLYSQRRFRSLVGSTRRLPRLLHKPRCSRRQFSNLLSNSRRSRHRQCTRRLQPRFRHHRQRSDISKRQLLLGVPHEAARKLLLLLVVEFSWLHFSVAVATSRSVETMNL